MNTVPVRVSVHSIALPGQFVVFLEVEFPSIGYQSHMVRYNPFLCSVYYER
jgi:hypothetical protein